MGEEAKSVEYRQATQKEIQITMTTGRYCKNEVTIKYTGVGVTETIGIREIKEILDELEKRNPMPAATSKQKEAE